uniref:Putative secreted protein n=1 Tax=Anopheles darlingi TaxID=43151 RepID=A0A2M4DI08_ANODA
MKACYALLLLLCVGMLVTKTLTACQRHDTHATHTSRGEEVIVIILIFPEKLAQPSRHTHHLMDSTFSSPSAIYSNQAYASMCSRGRALQMPHSWKIRMTFAPSLQATPKKGVTMA